MLPRGQALRSREGTRGPSAGPACPGQPRHRSAQHHALTSWSHGARARALHSSCHLSWCWHSSLHRRLHQRGSAVDVHATLPGRETRPQQSPVTQAHAAQLGKPVLAMPVTSSMVNASSRLLLWAEAGTMGYSGGSAGHSAPALVPAQVLALAAGCLGSEEEHWSGDAGFSRSRRRKKESSSTPCNRLPPISYRPQKRQQGTNQCDLRVDDPHYHLGLQQGVSQLGVLQQHVPGFLGAVLDAQLRIHTHRSQL